MPYRFNFTNNTVEFISRSNANGFAQREIASIVNTRPNITIAEKLEWLSGLSEWNLAPDIGNPVCPREDSAEYMPYRWNWDTLRVEYQIDNKEWIVSEISKRRDIPTMLAYLETIQSSYDCWRPEYSTPKFAIARYIDQNGATVKSNNVLDCTSNVKVEIPIRAKTLAEWGKMRGLDKSTNEQSIKRVRPRTARSTNKPTVVTAPVHTVALFDSNERKGIIDRAIAALDKLDDIDGIMCCGQSGIIFGAILSHLTDIPLIAVRKEGEPTVAGKYRNANAALHHPASRWVWVDDFVSSGGTMRRSMVFAWVDKVISTPIPTACIFYGRTQNDSYYNRLALRGDFSRDCHSIGFASYDWDNAFNCFPINDQENIVPCYNVCKDGV